MKKLENIKNSLEYEESAESLIDQVMSENESDNILQKYLLGIKNEPLLTSNEEQDLAKRIQKGSQKALKKMVRANLRLVVYVAKKYVWQADSLSLLDLIQEGNIGLHRAAQKFNHRKNNRFAGYAQHWIRQKIDRALKKSRAIYVPLNQLHFYKEVIKTKDHLTNTLQRKPTTKEIAVFLGVKKESIKEILEATHKIKSLQDKVTNQTDGYELGDTIEDKKTASDDSLIDRKTIAKAIFLAVAKLPEKDRELFCLFYIDNISQKEIAKKMSTSQDKIKKSLEKINKVLRKYPEIRQFQDYFNN